MAAVHITKERVRCFSLFAALLCFQAVPVANAYTPDDAEVVAMVEQAADFLKTNWHSSSGGDAEVGADALCALALLKAGVPADHRRIQQALETTRKSASRDYYQMYSPCLACILLCEVDHQGSQKEIEQYLQYILGKQRPNGWTYPSNLASSTGDVSQSQYAVLAMWAAKHRGFNVPDNAIVQALAWFIRVQDIEGGWTYQAVDPGPDGAPIRQGEVTHSMSAAGLGSTYILADMAGVKGVAATKEETTLPPDVRRVEAEDETEDARNRKVAGPVLTQCWAKGNLWFDRFFASDVKIENHEWPLYYLYALERYQSFREKFEGRSDPSPAWYNNGVEFLKQRRQGSSWRGNSSDGVSTAFAILFLTRSTRQSIGNFEKQAQLVAVGRINAKGELRWVGDRLVRVPVTTSVTELLDVIENSRQDELEDMASGPAPVVNFTGDADLRARQTAKLRTVMAAEDWRKRQLAVKLLARQRDLDNVPVLIYALSDPDREVANRALEGLRFISRKANGMEGVPNPPEPELVDGEETEAGKAAREKWVELAQEKWKEWYRLIRPNAEFLEP